MKIVATLLLASWLINVRAQPPGTIHALPLDSTRHVPHVVLKFCPLSLIDIDATIQGAVELRTSRRTSVQAEFGYGWPGFAPVGWSKPAEDYSRKEIWRGRLEARLYRNGRYPTRRPYRVPTNFSIGRYWAFESLYKQINVLESR